jgi:glycosyltransferase involved in cell wall biosynthesis
MGPVVHLLPKATEDHVTVSVVVPVFNECRYLPTILLKIQSVPVEYKEVIVVDDASTDGTRQLLEIICAAQMSCQSHVQVSGCDGAIDVRRLRILFQDRNRGKGAALNRGFAEASGDIVIVQDADLEYDPSDYQLLLQPILSGTADVVFGSRFLGGPHRVLFFWHYVANRGLTLLSNMFNNLNLTDMETCYKVFRREVLDAIDLEQERFGFEPEVTAKVAKLGVRVYEVPVSYHGRTYEQGKKIRARDALQAMWCIVRYGIWSGRSQRQLLSDDQPMSLTQDRSIPSNPAEAINLGNPFSV